MNPITSLQPWILDDKGCPKNPEEANRILKTLLEYLPAPDPEIVRKILARLVQTNFPKNTQVEKQALKLYRQVLKKFPHLFPDRTSEQWITINCGTKESRIPKNLLAAESDAFQAGFKVLCNKAAS